MSPHHSVSGSARWKRLGRCLAVLVASAGVLLSGHVAHAADPLGGDQASFPSTGDAGSSEPLSPASEATADVPHADTADRATHAGHADSADRASEADSAGSADRAAHADNASSAQHAEETDSAAQADHADTAHRATSVDEAATLSPDRCELGEVLARSEDAWICTPMPPGGGEVLFAQRVPSPAYSYLYGNDRTYAAFGELVDLGRPESGMHGSLTAVEGVLPRDGTLASLYVLRTPGMTRDGNDKEPDGIRTVVTVVVNGAPTPLEVTHDSDVHGAGWVANLDWEVPVQAGDTVAFLIDDGGSTCFAVGDTCQTHYNISLAFE